jgi:trehalose 6-phosphate phosphatase
LSEIVARGDLARPVDGAVDALRSLVRHPAFDVALISGRALADLRLRCPVEGCWYLGGHGNEVLPPADAIESGALPDESVLALAPFGAPMTPELQWLAERAKHHVEAWPGAVLEVKPASVAIHYRHAPHWGESIEAWAAAQAAAGSFRIVSGKCIVELIPLTARHKGHAVQELRRDLGCDLALYFGDDTTDEDVFRLQDPAVIGIHVGEPKHREGIWDTRSTAASYWLRNPQEVVQALRALSGRDFFAAPAGIRPLV